MATQTQKMPSIVTTSLVVVSVVFPCLSLFAIYLRYQARAISRQPIQADDWWVVAAWIFSLALSINAWVFGKKIGVDDIDINPLQGISYSLMCLLVSSAILQVALAVVKISVLCFYKRIFSTRKFRITAWIGIVAVAVWGIVFFFLVIFEGDPVSASWTGIGKFNFDTVKFGLSQVGTSIALDVVILFYPLPVLYGLHMRTSRKVAIGFIFWLGAFCCVAAIVRLVLLHASLAKVAKNESAVSNQSKQYIFMILEPNCSIIAACMPCFGPLVAGGKAPESLIRSVRSVFSLRSRSSRASQDKNRTQSNDNASSGSNIELTGADEVWAKNQASANTINVHRASLTGADDGETGQRIYMAKQYDVTRSQV